MTKHVHEKKKPHECKVKENEDSTITTVHERWTLFNCAICDPIF